MPDKFLVFKSSGNNLYSCWSKVSSIFTTLQGMYDFAMLKEKWIQTEIAMTSFQHPEWILGLSENGNIEFTTFRLYHVTPLRQVSIHRVNQARALFELASTSSQEKNSTRELILDCFRLYAQAMESVHNYNCFLSLWQLIENACISENINGNTIDVIKRINVIVIETKCFDIPIEGLYKSLSKKRNDLVHNGIDHTSNDDSNILKILSEAAIKWLIDKENKLNTKVHINEYFKLRTKNTKEKTAIQETINYLNSIKLN